MSITENSDIEAIRQAILRLDPDEVVVGKGKSQKVLFKKYQQLKAEKENKPGRAPKKTSSDEDLQANRTRKAKIVNEDDDESSTETEVPTRGKPSMGTKPTKNKVAETTTGRPKKNTKIINESTSSSSDTEDLTPPKRTSILNKGRFDKSETSANVIREMQEKKNKKVKFAIKGASKDTETRIDEIDRVIDYINDFSNLRDPDVFNTKADINKFSMFRGADDIDREIVNTKDEISHSFDYLYDDYLQQAKINKKRNLSKPNFIYRLAAQLSNDDVRPPYTSGDLIRAIDIIAQSNFVGSSVGTTTMAEEIMDVFGVTAYDEAVVGLEIAKAARQLFDDDYESVARRLADIQDPASYVKGESEQYRDILIQLYDLYVDKADALDVKAQNFADFLIILAFTESLDDISGSDLNIVIRRVVRENENVDFLADEKDKQSIYDTLVESYGPTGLDILLDAKPDLVNFLPPLERRPDETGEINYLLYIISEGQLSTAGIRLFRSREDAVKAAGKILKYDSQSVVKGLRDLKNKGTTKISGGNLILEEVLVE